MSRYKTRLGEPYDDNTAMIAMRRYLHAGDRVFGVLVSFGFWAALVLYFVASPFWSGYLYGILTVCCLDKLMPAISDYACLRKEWRDVKAVL